jgi:hypothetical protein
MSGPGVGDAAGGEVPDGRRQGAGLRYADGPVNAVGA